MYLFGGIRSVEFLLEISKFVAHLHNCLPAGRFAHFHTCTFANYSMAFSLPSFALRYLRFWIGAGNSRGHGMHSPFVYHLIRDVLNDRQRYAAYELIEQLRNELKADKTPLEVIDLGAGSSLGKKNSRSIGSIARHAAKPPRLAQLLFRLARYYQPATILELGTSLGISSSYLQLGQPTAQLLTLEGAPAVAEQARKNFEKLGLTKIRQLVGNFDETLQVAINELGQIDLAFVDGNHRYEPSVRYFQQLLPNLHNDSILIFDDIHWSADMEKAWNEIRSHAAVRCSVDLFFVGLVFFRNEFREPRHFNIRY